VEELDDFVRLLQSALTGVDDMSQLVTVMVTVMVTVTMLVVVV
jgi:hypothetical protein